MYGSPGKPDYYVFLYNDPLIYSNFRLLNKLVSYMTELYFTDVKKEGKSLLYIFILISIKDGSVSPNIASRSDFEDEHLGNILVYYY